MLLEQQNDEDEQEKGETTKPGTSTDPDAGMVTAPPLPPPPWVLRPLAARIRAARRPTPAADNVANTIRRELPHQAVIVLQSEPEPVR